MTILANQTDTDGRYDLIEGTFAPGVETPVHRHTTYAEQLYVLAGEFTVRTEGGTVVLGPGQSHFIPQGIAHSVAATSPEPAKGLVVASPSGFAALIQAVGTPSDGSGNLPTSPPDLEAFMRISAEIGDENLAPPGAPIPRV
ncbi:cupin domain-containing protein [Hymenobacter sp. 15J16-1T3B]|uniref:cupin domain-containing protein n=1 Tax=Hymenobacter sp. 15J16-1T3B TaxID=2886941 RepID=UPI001D12EE65|nr:cupin domain-containing protein [Hymenobacter sp. 15J16-1T3B]